MSACSSDFEEPLSTLSADGLSVQNLKCLQAEGGKYIAGLIGYSGDIPPNDEAGHVEFIKSIQPPDLWEVCAYYASLYPSWYIVACITGGRALSVGWLAMAARGIVCSLAWSLQRADVGHTCLS